MEPVQQLTYRSFTEADITGILSLWENYSGWGRITRQEFTDWYVNTPYGTCPIVVAENEEGEIVGQLSFIPAAVSVNGKVVKGLKLSAPILHRDFRLHELRSADHPAVLMISHGISMAKALGYSILYALPAHGWLGLLKMFPRLGLPAVETASYECVSVSLTNHTILEYFNVAGYNTILIEKFDESFDDLWKKVAVSFPIRCGIIRDSGWLEWKKNNHLLLKISKGDQLVGYAVYKKKDGLLVDILARTSTELKNVLLSSIKAMHFSNEKKITTGFEEVKLMCSPQLQPILKTIPVNPVNFQFAFCCLPLTDAIHTSDVVPENWYVMPVD